MTIAILLFALILIIMYFRRKRSSEGKIVAEIHNGDGSFPVNVVGESHYQKALSKICGGKTKRGHEFECTAYLILEDDNPRDDKAVKIMIEGKVVGYLSRTDARQYRKELTLAVPDATVKVAKCPALIVGGWLRDNDDYVDEGHFGVRLDLP